jgi:LysR family transcriptional regulator, transcriptional activator of nhaA
VYRVGDVVADRNPNGNWLNYNHLYYFWLVSKEGSITQAAEKVGVSPSSISTQISTLEKTAGHQLFKRVHRQMVLTEMGWKAYHIANEIFSLGQKVEALLDDEGGELRLVVGIAMVVPKLVVLHVLPMTELSSMNVRMVYVEDRPNALLGDLALGKIDVVLSDMPAPVSSRIQSFSHVLGKSGISLFASKTLLKNNNSREGLSVNQYLSTLPMLLPTTEATLRQQFDVYCSQQDLEPQVVAEFQDSAQVKVYGQHHWGAFLAPTCIALDICEQYELLRLGELPFSETFYAITMEKNIKDTVIARMVTQSQTWFAQSDTQLSTQSPSTESR